MRIIISFKNTEKERELFKIIKSKEEHSQFIKDAIIFYLENKKG